MQPDSKVVHKGRYPLRYYGMVNPPIYQTSTVLFSTIEDYENAGYGTSIHYQEEGAPLADLSYGIAGTPTYFALAEALADIEGGDYTLLYPSGLSAIAMTLLAFLQAGDHLLIPDSVYGPTRRLANHDLKRFGIEITYYDPLIGEDIKTLLRPTTKMVFVESPGSITFEVQDIPAIARVAKAHNALVVMDNSWATPLYFKPFSHGVDLSIHAISKYIGGHSDLLMGCVTTSRTLYPTLYKAFRHYGIAVSPNDCYLAQRGLRSMSARLKQHQHSALHIAEWLQGRKEVQEVLYPALPGAPGHALWKRDFTGACGLFSFILDPSYSQESVAKFLNGLQYFGIGCSWGGYESLILRLNPTTVRTASPWTTQGTLIRIHIGLEDPNDLLKDLEQGLQRLG